MFRQTRQLAVRQFSRSTATICDSPWFRLGIVVMLTCLLLPLPRARAMAFGFNQPQNTRLTLSRQPGDIVHQFLENVIEIST